MQTLQQLLSGELKGTKHLKLSCGLTEFPQEIFSLSDTLEILDLSGNQLSALPEDFGRLSKLKIVFFSENLFTELPSVLSDCKQLGMIGFKSNRIKVVPEKSLPTTTRWLILTNNQIEQLPTSIGKCEPLQKCALAGNRLKSLPKEMANCKNLELLRISANQFTEIPNWLLELPKLSWLAFSGNPFASKRQHTNKLKSISWNEFEILELLGQGASGHIYKAKWKNKTSDELVAIKVFKGEVTSDGFPEDEMQASVAAGVHKNLVGLLGEIENHPQQKQGLIMKLIPANFFNLGMPPDFETCSRDTFKTGTVFSISQILKIVSAVASTTTHLHMLGINHGDLYAHNTLSTENADTLIGDFGAASFYDSSTEEGIKIQKIEVRAFGCLLDDLLDRLSESDENSVTAIRLKDMRFETMQTNVDKRPLFSEIESLLEVIK